MGKLLYVVAVVGGFCLRQFALPNPFEPLGNNAETLNLIFGGIFIPISFAMTGIMYKRGTGAFVGSLLFTATYALNTFVTYLVCLVYPITWLMILITVVYLILYIVGAIMLRVHVLYP